MKTVRFLLLVLLALVLPFKGTLAAGGHCTAAGGQHVHAGTSGHPVADAHAGEAAVQAQDLFGADTAPKLPQDPGKCGNCTTACGVVPFVGSPFALITPASAAGPVFPALAAPPPSHPSGGQDRPPRHTS